MESNKLIEDSAGRSGQPLRRVAYHNGCWVSGDDVALSPMDPAVTQGVTAVERVRVYNGRPFQLQLHLDRLTRTTEALFITG